MSLAAGLVPARSQVESENPREAREGPMARETGKVWVLMRRPGRNLGGMKKKLMLFDPSPAVYTFDRQARDLVPLYSSSQLPTFQPTVIPLLQGGAAFLLTCLRRLILESLLIRAAWFNRSTTCRERRHQVIQDWPGSSRKTDQADEGGNTQGPS